MSSPQADSSSQEIDPKSFRATLGRFATGVTVVTTVENDKIHGMTASAFMSVSLDPPLVVVSVDKRAHLHTLLAPGKHYGVSILKAEQAAYSQHFAGLIPLQRRRQRRLRLFLFRTCAGRRLSAVLSS